MRILPAVLALAATAAACPPPDVGGVDPPREGEGEGEGEGAGEGEGEDLPPLPLLPQQLHLEGAASGLDGDLSADCSFFADFGDIVVREDGFDATILGGEVFRRVEPADGEGFGGEFQALIGGQVTMRRTAEGDELRFVGDQTDAPRFWRAIEVLRTAHAEGEAAWAGTWSCEPIDVDEPPGFVDTTAIVAGTWTLQPL